MYPRFLSFVLSKLLDQSVIEQGGAVYMNSQTVKVFTSMASAAIVPIETVETPPSVKPTKKSMSSRKRKPAQTRPVEPRQSKRAKKGVQEDEVHEPAAETQTRKTKVVVPEEAHLDHEPFAEPQSSAHEPIDVHQQSSILTYKRRSSKRPRGDNIIKTSTTTTLLNDTSLEVVEQRYPGRQETTTGGEIEHTGDEGSLNPELKVKKLKAIFTYLSSKMLALENRVITQGLEIDELRMQLAKKHEPHTAAAPVAQSASEKVGRLDVGMDLKVDFKGETLTKGSFKPKVKPLKEVIVTGFADEPKSAGESIASEAKLPSEKAHTALDTLANLASLAILREDTASPEAILYERIPDSRPYERWEEGPQIQKSKAQRRDDQWIVSKLSKLTSTNILRCNHCSASTRGSGGSVVFYPSCNDQDPIEISYSDIDLLAPGGWLNDSIMNFYLRYLQLNVTPTNGAISDYHFCNTFFYDKLKEVLSPKVIVEDSYNNFRRWFYNKNIFEKLYIVIPIHEPFHWSLVIICMGGKGHKAGPIILHFDSFGTCNKSQIVENIKRFMEEEVKLGSLKSSGQEVNIEVPKQPNTSDCGVYVLLYIEHFIQQAPKRMKTEYSTMFGENWFEEKEASGLRSRIQSLLRDIFKSAPGHAEGSPTIQDSDLKMHPVGVNDSSKANAGRSENEEEEKNENNVQKPMVKSKNKKYVNKNDTNLPNMETPAAQVTTGPSEGVSSRFKRPTSMPRRLLD